MAHLNERMSQLVNQQHLQATALLASIPGFGPVTIGAFLEVLSGFHGWQEAQHAKAFIKYIGLAPTRHESGKSVREASHINRLAVLWLGKSGGSPAAPQPRAIRRIWLSKNYTNAFAGLANRTNQLRSR